MLLNIPAYVQYLVLISLLDFIQLFQTTSQFIQIILKANCALNILAVSPSSVLSANLINILSVKVIMENVEQKQEHNNRLSLTPTMQKISPNHAGFSIRGM